MENPNTSYDSIQGLKRREDFVDNAERQRFWKDMQAIADVDELAAAWLKEHFDELV